MLSKIWVGKYKVEFGNPGWQIFHKIEIMFFAILYKI